MSTQPSTGWRQPVWRSLTEPAEVAAALIELLEVKGRSRYDESVTQLEHALQTATNATTAGATDCLVIAALLHDVGHLLMDEHGENRDFLAADRAHEDVGARFLANWFDADVTEPIALHVPAKRYLCAIDQEYHLGLSAASVRSLEVQGGRFDPAEADEFARVPGAMESVDLRRWDDSGKVAGAPTMSVDEFQDVIVRYLEAVEGSP